jgi:hypothetical protein
MPVQIKQGFCSCLNDVFNIILIRSFSAIVIHYVDLCYNIIGFHFHQTLVSFVPGSLSPTSTTEMPLESPNELASLQACLVRLVPSYISISLNTLPFQIIINVLSLFPRRALLPLTMFSRMYDLIIIVIHNSLPAAASLAGHKVILECCRPHARLSAPHFF